MEKDNLPDGFQIDQSPTTQAPAVNPGHGFVGTPDLVNTLVSDKSPPQGDDSIQSTWSPLDFIPYGEAGNFARAAIDAAPSVVGNEEGAITLVSSGGKNLPKGAQITRETPTLPAVSANDHSTLSEPTMLDRFKARFGDNPEAEKLANEFQDPEAGPWSINEKLGVVPNYSSEPNGVIGSPGISEPHPSNANKEPDPLSWYDMKHGSTKKLLEEHSKAGLPLEINTSSDMVGHSDYIDSYPDGTHVNMYLLPENSELSRAIFPGNPSRARQLNAVDALRKSGIYVNAIEPTWADILGSKGKKYIEQKTGMSAKEVRNALFPRDKFHVIQGAKKYAEGGVVTKNNDDDGISPPPGFEIDKDFGTPAETAKTALEQGLSGLTLGGSKVLETKLLGVNPKDIEAREQANPITSFVGNALGTIGLGAATAGVGVLPEATTLAGKAALGAAEGLTIGGVNQLTDDWSQNKALDAQRIAASAGLGALIGGVGSAAIEGVRTKFSPLAKIPASVASRAEEAATTSPETIGSIPVEEKPVFDVPEKKAGVQPTSLSDMAARVERAQQSGELKELPMKNELMDAVSRVPMENSVSPAQIESLGNQNARDIYRIRKETPDEIGNVIKSYEALQKAELVNQTEKAISDLAPGHEPISDAYKAGEFANEAFTNQYQAEKKALSPMFEALKETPYNGNLTVDTISALQKALPQVAEMLTGEGDKIKVGPYYSRYGLDRSTYNAVADVVKSLKGAKSDLETLWRIRGGLDQHVDTLAQGQGPSQIMALKAALMTQMEDASGPLREQFKRYAINEGKRGVVEKVFGASAGTPEFGQISKVKPEYIGDKIFANSANVEAAKNILPPEKFRAVLSNWLSEAKAKVTDKGVFSSNKWGSFLRRNQDALNAAFSDNPDGLQRLKDMTTIMRILPDAPSVNPSGTAKTLYQMMNNFKNMSWEGMIASLPHKAFEALQNKVQMAELNKALAGDAAKTSAMQGLRRSATKTAESVDRKVREIFRSRAIPSAVSSAASEAKRKQ